MSDPSSLPHIRRLFGFRWRTLIALGGLAMASVVALGLDLVLEGRVYDYLWNVTGETDPAQQVLGFGQYLMRYTRQQPETQPFARIENADVSPFGVNTFLEQEVEPEKREQQVQLIADAGFKWIRQQFPWEDIEIHAKGDFVDRRHVDLQGEVSAWIKYDHIVDLAEAYDLDIIVRLSAPPPWSQPEGTTNHYTPPEDFQDFVDFAATVANRYRGRLHHYQVWNEPNLYPEWGDQTVNAEAYTELLCRTYDALKAIDPTIVVITGALGPTIDLSGRNAYDLLYLQRMYQAGAGDCFDVLSVQGYGLWSGPTDRRLRQVTVNYQRHLWIRDMMVANGDAHKPIWLSEAAWNPVPDDPTIIDWERYGQVTMDQAAAWAPLAYQRAIEEWPWIGVVAWWYFKPADDHNQTHSWYYFRLVEPDFTPTPVYDALKAYMTGAQPKPIGAGWHGIQAPGLAERDDEAGVTRYTFRVKGTGIYLCSAAAAEPGTVPYEIAGGGFGVVQLPAGEGACVRLCDDLDAGTHTLVLTVPDGSALDSLAVVDFGARRRLPWLLTGVIAAAFVGLILAHAVGVRLDRAQR